MPVADLAAPDSALFLWATFPQLPEALRLIEAWGFTYKSVAFVWLKKNKKADSWFYGLGFWTRGNAEICLLATKGHPKRQAANIHQFIISPIEAHSKKPDEARAKILSLMGDLPRVELFARQTPPGWAVSRLALIYQLCLNLIFPSSFLYADDRLCRFCLCSRIEIAFAFSLKILRSIICQQKIENTTRFSSTNFLSGWFVFVSQMILSSFYLPIFRKMTSR